MSELFRNYEDEYKEMKAIITTDMAEASTKAPAIQTNLDKLKDTLRNMETEVNDVPEATRALCRSRVQTYRRELPALEKEFQRVRAASQRDVLKPSAATTANGTAEEQRQRMAGTTKSLEQQTEMIDQGRRLIAETEKKCEAILRNLATQRDSIDRSTKLARETNAELAKGRRVMSQMK